MQSIRQEIANEIDSALLQPQPAVNKSVDQNHFGTIPGSSTVMAFIGMVHKLLRDTDGTGSTIRVFVCDSCKAFVLIHHSLLC